MSYIENEAGRFHIDELCGYRPDLLDGVRSKLGQPQQFRLWGQGPTSSVRTMLWEFVRKVIGKDPLNYPQQVGDCFVAGTMVNMADGSTKPIERILPGDMVVSHKNNVKMVARTVKKKFSGKLVTLRAKGYFGTVTATADHQFKHYPYEKNRRRYRDPSWTAVGEFTVGDRVLMPYGTISEDATESLATDDGRCDDGIIVKIQSLSHQQVENVEVYCLEVDEDHSFIANGFAVHNCTSFGAKNACEYLQAFEMAQGTRAEWHYIFPSYIYGCGRVFVEGVTWGLQDGASGQSMAEAVTKYGVLRSDFQGVPQYSGSIAREWGRSPGPPKSFITEASQHLVKSTAQVSTWNDLGMALTNGYPVTVASNWGFQMSQSSDGFFDPSGTWNHQMCIIGFDPGDDKIEPHAAILNSWGDLFGVIKDFRTGEPWPIGTLRVRKTYIEKMLAQQDSYAYSNLNGFPARQIDRSNFDLW